MWGFSLLISGRVDSLRHAYCGVPARLSPALLRKSYQNSFDALLA